MPAEHGPQGTATGAGGVLLPNGTGPHVVPVWEGGEDTRSEAASATIAGCGTGKLWEERGGPAEEAPRPADTDWTRRTGADVPEGRPDDPRQENAEELADVLPMKTKGFWEKGRPVLPNPGPPFSPPTQTASFLRGANSAVDEVREGGLYQGAELKDGAPLTGDAVAEPHGRPTEDVDGDPKSTGSRDPPLPDLNGGPRKSCGNRPL